MPLPTLTELVPLIKFVPLKVTYSVSSLLPVFGEILVKVGTGLLIENVWLPEVPPPGLLFVTEKFRAPVVAFAPIMMLTVKLSEV